MIETGGISKTFIGIGRNYIGKNSSGVFCDRKANGEFGELCIPYVPVI
jgi:hypothetical protein